MIKYCISDFKTAIKNNHFKSDIKKYIKSNGIVFIPSDPSNMIITKKYGLEIVNIFINEGITFDNISYISDIDDLVRISKSIEDYDLIFLMGGKTKVQNRFLHSIEFNKFLKKFDGIVLGQSAGALNLCKTVYLSPYHGENERLEYLNGLGAINALIEVHFNINNEKQNSSLQYSKDEIICICDNAAVKFDKETVRYYGDVYSCINGKCSKLEVVE